MATTTNIERVASQVAAFAAKWNISNWLPTAASSSSSAPSSFSQIKEELEKLCLVIKWIRALLADAEKREIREETVKLWLDELRDVAYDAEDVVEEFEYELKRDELVRAEEEQINDATNLEGRGIKRKCQALDDVVFQQQILDDIKRINKRFDEICKCKHDLMLSENDGQMKQQQDMMERPPTSSILSDSHVYGRDDDEKKVISMLLPSQQQQQQHEQGTDQNVSVVSINGMGGIGKTTLAQRVYNDHRVRNHFQVRSWVCVSDCFDVDKLTKDILESATGKPTHLQVFNSLQEKLRDELEGKRFLLVLDDLWNENSELWKSLWGPLRSGAKGSKVLITTRNEEVSKISRAVETHHLNGLLIDDSWSLFAACAFGGCENPNVKAELISTGKQIVKKCGGLPLAIRTLGGMLFNETDEDKWNDILNSDLWELPEERNAILPALKLSYHHLPSPIRPCFAFCAVFPKDHQFDREELILMWMAQGYIIPGGTKPMEDVGRQYFDQLLQRSFFDEYFSRFKMHDLIHDLARTIWGSECFTVEDGNMLPPINHTPSRKVRHLSFTCGLDDMMKLLTGGSADKFQYSRTSYLVGSNSDYDDGEVSDGSDFPGEVPDDLFNRMKSLRVLHLQNLLISESLNSAGQLKHLRYLSISGDGFIWRRHRLPESLGNLLNLQTLKILSYDGTIELPTRFKNLVNMRHLEADYNLNLSYTVVLPRGIGKLTQLRTLPGDVIVGEGAHGAGIEELRHLNDLQGSKLEIQVRSLNDDWVNNRKPDILSQKKGLKRLSLCLDECKGTRQRQEEMLELVQPHTNLEYLNISGYIGSRFPKWMGHPSYSKLEHLLLCPQLEFLLGPKQLPSFSFDSIGRLPSLKYLAVQSVQATRGISNCESLAEGRLEVSPLWSLETLSLNYVPNLEELLLIGTEDGGKFPRLRELRIKNCNKLRYVKLRHLTALRTLDITFCIELAVLDVYDDDHQRGIINSTLVGVSGDLQHQQQNQQEEADEVRHRHMHMIPRVHTMHLYGCPKLHFMSPQRQLPSSLRCFSFAGSPRVKKWVKRHIQQMSGVSRLVSRPGRPCRRGHQLVFCNIEDVEEAEAIDLNAEPARKWEFRWDLHPHHRSSSSHSFGTPEEAENILNHLCRYYSYSVSEVLRELVIEGYKGRSLPKWVWCSSYLPNLAKMTLSGCINLECLPPLGELDSLRELHISNMDNVGRVDQEFYIDGEPDRDPFPKLRVLTIRNFPKLTTFLLSFQLTDDSAGDASPSACDDDNWLSLSLSLPSSSTSSASRPTPTQALPLLERLLVEDCPKLVSLTGIHGISSLRRLSLQLCPALDLSNEARLSPMLDYAVISGCPLLSGWCQGDRISHLRGLWVDRELVFSDGSTNADCMPAEILEIDEISSEENIDQISTDEDDEASSEENIDQISTDEDDETSSEEDIDQINTDEDDETSSEEDIDQITNDEDDETSTEED